MKKTIVLLCLACGLVLGSCIPASYSFGTLHKHLMDIRNGMNETEIISLLGKPDYRRFKGNREEWEYRNSAGSTRPSVYCITFVDGKVNSFDSYLDESPWKKGLRNDSTIQAGYFRTPEGNFMWGVPANGMVRLNNGRLMPARGNQLLQEP